MFHGATIPCNTVTRSPQSHDVVVSRRFARVCDIAVAICVEAVVSLRGQVDVTICIVNRRSADRPCNERSQFVMGAMYD